MAPTVALLADRSEAAGWAVGEPDRVGEVGRDGDELPGVPGFPAPQDAGERVVLHPALLSLTRDGSEAPASQAEGPGGQQPVEGTSVGVVTLCHVSSKIHSEFGTLGERVAAMKPPPAERPVDPARHVWVTSASGRQAGLLVAWVRAGDGT